MTPAESSLSISALKEAVAEKRSQSALAREISVSQATIWKWLNGRHPIPAEGAMAIERVTGVPKERLRPDLSWNESFAATGDTRLAPRSDFGDMEPAR